MPSSRRERRQQPPPPPDDPHWANATPFRVLERAVRRTAHPAAARDPHARPLEKLVCPLGDIDNDDGDTAGECDSLLPGGQAAKCVRLHAPQAMPSLGLAAAAPVAVHTLAAFPGLSVLRRLVPPPTQRALAALSLRRLARPPNLTNLDAHFVLPDAGIWTALRAARRTEAADPSAPPVCLTPRGFPADGGDEAGGDTESCPAGASPRRAPAAASTKPSPCGTAPTATAEEAAAVAASADQSADLRIDPPTDKMAAPKPAPIARAIMRMRWVTLGFQYNWTLKEYFFDRRPAFPPSVDAITREIVTLLAPVTGYSADRWRSEAGIVNFYHPGDTLTAHQDRSEIDMDAPLVSLSIGLDAVFLFGTESRDDKPVALRLRSGDVVVMAGPARRAFHGVPLVLPDTCPEYLRDAAASWDAGLWAGEQDGDPVSDDEARDLAEFMGTTRININVRQVLPVPAHSAACGRAVNACG